MSKPRAILTAAILLCSLTAFSSAANRFLADLSGTWNVSVQTPDQAVTSVLVVAQKGDSLSGTLESEIGRAPVTGRVKGDTVSFVFSLDMGGQALTVSAAGVMTDKNSFAGQMDVSGMGSMPFSAKRQP